MRILHINYTDKGGGAAIAASRHHEAMRRAGIDSHMLVQVKKSDDPHVHQYKVCAATMFMKRVLGRLFTLINPFYATWSWNHYGFDPSDDSEVKDADIIILHWVNAYTVSIKAIEKILKTGKPVYWFMHDMWPVTGGCHYSFDCTKYREHCRRCEMAHNHRGSHRDKDLSYRQFNEKMNRLSPYKNLRFLTPSRWLADRVQESALFGNHDVAVARNVLDTEMFKLVDKNEARNRLGLPLDKKLILFGADNVFSPYKGWPLLREALSRPIDGVEAVIYGMAPANLQAQIGIKLHSMGHISDISRLIDLYNACDVFVTPSLADNYPNVLIEAMACGLPCIGTNVGGIPEIISSPHGYLVTTNESNELGATIKKVLNCTSIRDSALIREEIVNKNGYNQGLVAFFLSRSIEC